MIEDFNYNTFTTFCLFYSLLTYNLAIMTLFSVTFRRSNNSDLLCNTSMVKYYMQISSLQTCSNTYNNSHISK